MSDLRSLKWNGEQPTIDDLPERPEVVPRSVAEALAEALRRINGGVPYWAPTADVQRIAREALAEYRAAYPKQTPCSGESWA